MWRRGVDFFKSLKSRLNIDSLHLVGLFAFYFGFILNMSFWRFIYSRLEIASAGAALFAVSLPILGMAIFVWIFDLLLLPRVGKWIIIPLLLISSGTNYLMFNLGAFIDLEMARNVFETNAREAFDLITASGVVWVFSTGVIPAALLFFTKINFYPPRKEILRRAAVFLAAMLAVGIICAASYRECAPFIRNNKQMRKLLNTVNYVYSVARYFQTKAKANRPFVWLDENAKLSPDREGRTTVLVFILGETARAKNFSLGGYGRKTNPLLEKQDIIYFKNVKSCGTSTAISAPCIFSSKTRKEFRADEAKTTENLLDLIKKAGYDIFWLENDDGCKGVCDRVAVENMVSSGAKEYCFGQYCLDEALLKGLEEKLKNIQKNTAIFLHTMGSHGPTYYQRYPEQFRAFLPTCDTADIQNCSKESIVNAYDNTILYTDYIISSAIDALKKFPNLEAGLAYVSDHGESLGENNIYLHGFPYAIAPAEQIEVPMLLWVSETMRRLNNIDYGRLGEMAKTKNYTHDNIFHSMLGLLGIESKLYQADKDFIWESRRELGQGE
ncbi:MAG: phosphoethanolamine--lipid A transferase [Rickettsiales bacterium]|jgi:lipid A ethanolaminephosphotransferase|nr:phosphoethanolamine--lipid A transferase [Rickettsiales bacterium]